MAMVMMSLFCERLNKLRTFLGGQFDGWRAMWYQELLVGWFGEAHTDNGVVCNCRRVGG